MSANRQEARAATRAPSEAPSGLTAIVDELQRRVAGEIGAIAACLDPVFAEARAILVALDPPPDVEPLAPDARAAKKARLAELCDALEDRIEALRLGATGRRGRRA